MFFKVVLGPCVTLISHIVDITGFGKGNIAYHFKNKQDVLKLIIKQWLAWNKLFFTPNRATKCNYLPGGGEVTT